MNIVESACRYDNVGLCLLFPLACGVLTSDPAFLDHYYFTVFPWDAHHRL